ncbi:MAG TPA: phosphoheptose isomerase [Bacteroidetes bacterium]|nr:phosphoheptose isomerase [Bacteroidota bacterium]
MPDQNIFKKTAQSLDKQGFKIVAKDEARPWGGFFVIDEKQAPRFIETFFPSLSIEDFKGFEKLSPKILMVRPGKRLSWQYHHRRSEIWRLIDGEAGVVKSPTDEQTDVHKLKMGELVRLECGERHRLVGLDDWGVLAEIWQHVDAANPSDEEDIVRVEDDFGR